MCGPLAADEVKRATQPGIRFKPVRSQLKTAIAPGRRVQETLARIGLDQQDSACSLAGRDVERPNGNGSDVVHPLGSVGRVDEREETAWEIISQPHLGRAFLAPNDLLDAFLRQIGLDIR